MAPGLAERLLAVLVDRLHLSHERPALSTNGNLFALVAEGAAVSGGWKPRGARRILRSVALGAAALLPAALGWMWLRPRLAALRE